ncbi:MAG: S8 family serine peptidase [Thermoplasmatota archaeon]
MRFRNILMLTLLVPLIAAGTLAFIDHSASARPDPTPFGFDMEFWYDDQAPALSDLDISIPLAFQEMGGDAELEMVVQFHPPLTDEDIRAAEDAGMDVLHRMKELPAVFARGDRDSIEKLARYKGTYWIENNTIQQFMMQDTTTVINASKTWNSPVVDALKKEYPAIDGRGNTIVVLDSGVDAGHPDLDLGEKTIKNYKSDSDYVWREVENADTSSGHGTHCAGTVAGNGDASSGAMAGVARGSKLIGLSTGEAVSIFNAVGGMEWVLEHSKPGHTYEWQEPIRAVSNSWGPAPGDYNPEDSLSKLSQRITFENNVIVVFAASNSGGDGTDIQTNPYGNIPSNIAVAAIAHDGSGVASFSSRGEMGMETTYPDVGAPGVNIMSTAARRTYISLMTKQGGLSTIDPYYFAISGTSMATPHIAGVVGLLFQAYPGLSMSEYVDEASEDKMENWNGGMGWVNDTRNRVHEIELILEASAHYILPSDGGEPLAENYVPQNFSVGWNGEPFDYAQGFGNVQVDRAIGIALTLKELRERDFDGDGLPDNPDMCVKHAIEQYQGVMKVREKTFEGNRIYSSWNGEWSRFSNQTSQPIPVQHDISKMVYIPDGAEELEVRFTYDPWNTDEKRVASLFATIDYNGDGSPDWVQTGGVLDDARIDTISLSGMPTGEYWSFNVEGRGVDWNIGERFRESQFKEVRVEFTVSLNLTFGPGEHVLPEQDPHPRMAYWKPFGDPVDGASINISEYYYDLGEVKDPYAAPDEGGEEGGVSWLLILLIIAVLAAAGIFAYKKKDRIRSMLNRGPGKEHTSSNEPEIAPADPVRDTVPDTLSEEGSLEEPDVKEGSLEEK